MSKRAYILTKAISIPFEKRSGYYDELQQLNVLPIHDNTIPLAQTEQMARTTSKTARYPGDDDADPEAIECY